MRKSYRQTELNSLGYIGNVSLGVISDAERARNAAVEAQAIEQARLFSLKAKTADELTGERQSVLAKFYAERQKSLDAIVADIKQTESIYNQSDTQEMADQYGAEYQAKVKNLDTMAADATAGAQLLIDTWIAADTQRLSGMGEVHAVLVATDGLDKQFNSAVQGVFAHSPMSAILGKPVTPALKVLADKYLADYAVAVKTGTQAQQEDDARNAAAAEAKRKFDAQFIHAPETPAITAPEVVSKPMIAPAAPVTPTSIPATQQTVFTNFTPVSVPVATVASPIYNVQPVPVQDALTSETWISVLPKKVQAAVAVVSTVPSYVPYIAGGIGIIFLLKMLMPARQIVVRK
jgi:hypothetical protein